MDDLPEQVARFQAKRQELAYQFLQTELQTSFIAIDMGNTELGLGNREVAERESRAAEKAYYTISRFLPDLESDEQRAEVRPSRSSF